MKEQLNKRVRSNKRWHRNENRNKLLGKELFHAVEKNCRERYYVNCQTFLGKS
jgi:hypothetical protein